VAGLTFARSGRCRSDRPGNNPPAWCIDDGKHSILLTGDIETGGTGDDEPLLAASCVYTYPGSAPRQQYLCHCAAAAGRRRGGAGFASRYNAWRMPSAKVVQRYRQQGYRWFDTPHQGQITVVFSRRLANP
jgi:competence protein ComEC